MISLSRSEIKNLRICGQILRHALTEAMSVIKPGISSYVIDQIAEKTLRKNGAKPSFLNYQTHHGNPFPNSICVSINCEVVHGIPKKDKILRDGDLVGLDLGAEYQGMHTDMAETVIVGKAGNKNDIKLVSAAREALGEGIKEAIAGNYTGDIGRAIQKCVEKKGFNVIRSLVGHGIGRAPHTDPQIPNFGQKGQGTKLENNMAIAIEPMVAAGSFEVRTASDGWSVLTSDGLNSAHFEHTVLINGNKPEVVTK